MGQGPVKMFEWSIVTIQYIIKSEKTEVKYVYVVNNRECRELNMLSQCDYIDEKIAYMYTFKIMFDTSVIQ